MKTISIVRLIFLFMASLLISTGCVVEPVGEERGSRHHEEYGEHRDEHRGDQSGEHRDEQRRDHHEEDEGYGGYR